MDTLITGTLLGGWLGVLGVIGYLWLEERRVRRRERAAQQRKARHDQHMLNLAKWQEEAATAETRVLPAGWQQDSALRVKALQQAGITSPSTLMYLHGMRQSYDAIDHDAGCCCYWCNGGEVGPVRQKEARP